MPNNAPAATGPQQVPVKMQVKPHVLAKATDITAGFVVANKDIWSIASQGKCKVK